MHINIYMKKLYDADLCESSYLVLTVLVEFVYESVCLWIYFILFFIHY